MEQYKGYVYFGVPPVVSPSLLADGEQAGSECFIDLEDTRTLAMCSECE